jgi:hypothetical protein
LKRRWLLDRRAADAQASLAWYRQALDQAHTARHHSQIYYHAINVAFMEWAYGGDRAAAQTMARVALDACALAPADRWRRSTEGEAAIILGDGEAALTAYGQALELASSPREIDSMYQQASFELDLADDLLLARKLQELFLSRARADAVRVG